MSVHDWTRVDAGIFHAFHHRWISAIADVLNVGLLPEDYYALAEQQATAFGPDVLTLQGSAGNGDGAADSGPVSGRGGVLLAVPKLTPTAETDMEFYRRKQNSVVVRHVSGDRMVAVVELVSSSNKAGTKPFRAFLDKATQLLDKGIHLLIVDLYPPTRRDPRGIHAAIWAEITGQEEFPVPEKPLTAVAYEADLAIRAYVQQIAVGDSLPDMPLFLEPRGCVNVPFDDTYQSAFQFMPRRWRRVLEPTS